jgi:hypothetical protein
MVRLKVATGPNLLFDGRTCRLNGLRSGGLGLKRQLRFGRSYRGAGRPRGLSGGWGMDDAWTLNLRSVPRTVIYDNQRHNPKAATTTATATGPNDRVGSFFPLMELTRLFRRGAGLADFFGVLVDLNRARQLRCLFDMFGGLMRLIIVFRRLRTLVLCRFPRHAVLHGPQFKSPSCRLVAPKLYGRRFTVASLNCPRGPQDDKQDGNGEH